MKIGSLRIRHLALSFWGGLASVYAVLFFLHMRHFPRERLLAAISERGSDIFYIPLRDLFEDTILTVPFWGAIVFTLCLQRLIPAKPEQKIFSTSLAQDAVWFIYEAVLQALIVALYVDYLVRFYDKHFSALTITALNQSPGWVRFLLALLLTDLLFYAQHFCHHKIPAFWRMHALHHSQKELNFFTDFRYHVLEYVVRQTFLVIPFLILKVEAPTVVGFSIFYNWYSRFYHGNIRTNLGPLRYLLVTPQSHRLHHSIEAAHRDTNFGAIFSIWDHLLGTQCKIYDEYPDTGIADEAFPHEETIGLKSLLLTPLKQMLYSLLSFGRGTAVAGEADRLSS